MKYSDILNFWFKQLSAYNWFPGNEMLDLKMVEKFIVIHSKAISLPAFYEK